MSRVFISYSHKDREFVQRLALDLRRRPPGLDVFYDMLIKPGASWAQSLVAEIERADVVLTILSPEYLSSVWGQQELNVALQRKLDEGVRLIPVLIRPCSPQGFLSLLTWVDFTSDYEDAFARLIWGITGKPPQLARGEEPGELPDIVDRKEIDALGREVHEAVEVFKSIAQERESATSREHRSKALGKRRCFVIMPFGDPDLQVVYEDFVRPTLESDCNLVCERGDDVFGSNVIMDDIVRSIDGADVILADLTGRNPNVFYEVGICHALKKPVLLLTQSIDEVPFDLRHRRVLMYDYSPRGCKRLEGTLAENMRAVLAEV